MLVMALVLLSIHWVWLGGLQTGTRRVRFWVSLGMYNRKYGGFLVRHRGCFSLFRPPFRRIHCLRYQAAAPAPSRASCLTKMPNLCPKIRPNRNKSVWEEAQRRGHWLSITGAEFSPVDDGMFITTGLDGAMKVSCWCRI